MNAGPNITFQKKQVQRSSAAATCRPLRIEARLIPPGQVSSPSRLDRGAFRIPSTRLLRDTCSGSRLRRCLFRIRSKSRFAPGGFWAGRGPLPPVGRSSETGGGWQRQSPVLRGLQCHRTGCEGTGGTLRPARHVGFAVPGLPSRRPSLCPAPLPFTFKGSLFSFPQTRCPLPSPPFRLTISAAVFLET